MMFLIRIDHQSTTEGIGASTGHIESILKGVSVLVEDYSVSELEALFWVYRTGLVSYDGFLLAPRDSIIVYRIDTRRRRPARAPDHVCRFQARRELIDKGERSLLVGRKLVGIFSGGEIETRG
jgi:hypothetical protein